SGKVDILKRIRPPPPESKFSLVADDVQVRTLGDTALVTSVKTVTWSGSGRPYSDKYRASNTYARKNGRWLLIARQQAHEWPPYVAKDVALNLKVDDAFTRGDKKATIVLIEISDYQCPYCRRFAAETLKQIEQNYVDTGRIAFVYRDYPLETMHPFAFKA